MKKIFTVLLALVLMLSMLSACTVTNKGSTAEPEETSAAESPIETAEPTSNVTDEPTALPTEVPTAEPTEVPTAEPTEAPTAIPTAARTATAKPTPTPTPAPTPFPIPDAYVGYYDSVKRTSVIPGETYLNLFENRIYYTKPGSQAVIPAPGNASDWSVQKDEFSLVKKTEVMDGRYVLTTNPNKTGYLYLKNKKTAEVVKVYVISPAPQEADRKQTDKSVPYFLYLEKGSYTSFIPGTCCLTIYKADKDGYYTIPYLTLLSSAGTTISLTPTGLHTLDVAHRERWHPWVEDGAPSMWGQYVISYEKGRFVHSPCTAPNAYDDISQMDIVSNYNYVGTHCSGGCLRMQTGSAYWVWANCTAGTKLKIVNGNPLGTRIEPLVKINKTTGYDPTDPYLYTGKMIDV